MQFTTDDYCRFIRDAKTQGYRFFTFKDAFQEQHQRAVMLRHDVDFSLEYARDLAKIERDNDVSSTYFIMVSCEYYNILSPDGRALLREITELGHEIGLHWDSRYYPTAPEQLAATLRSEIHLLSLASNQPVVSASQHVPTDTPFIDVSDILKIEAYSERIRSRYQYVSDSSMLWRATKPFDLLGTADKIQFLTHPIWWIAEGANLAEKMRHFGKDLGTYNQRIIEDYIAYTEKVNRNRDAYDKSFVEKRAWFKS